MAVPRSALLLAVPALLQAQPAEEILAKVDRLRHPWTAFTAEVRMVAGKTEQRWKVHARENGDTRIEGLSGKELGRVVLILGEDMWLVLPGARRPVRVTPQQRMLGPAAGGDLARTRFAEDYEIQAKVEDSSTPEAAWRLDLKARRSAMSYRTARLWVARAGHPLRADFHLASGKLSKTLRFDPPQAVKGTQVVPGMTVEEPKGGTATLRFSDWRPGAPDPALFRLPELPSAK